ncbi:MAG: hypothetical protein R3C29_17745 [Dehalococcoidia bacterium]
MSEFGPINAAPLCGTEPIGHVGTVLDFWRWSSSDFLSNATRGILAEFIVARALGDPSPVRKEWDAYDVTTPEGIRVEVKSAAYIQSWHQEKPSQISFGIAPTMAWDAETNAWGTERKRQPDVHVFALLDCQDQSRVIRSTWVSGGSSCSPARCWIGRSGRRRRSAWLR